MPYASEHLLKNGELSKLGIVVFWRCFLVFWQLWFPVSLYCFLFSWQEGSTQTLWMRLAAYQEPEGTGSSSRNRGNQAAGLFWGSAHASCVWSGQLESVRRFLTDSVAYSHRRVTGPLKAHFPQSLLHRTMRQTSQQRIVGPCIFSKAILCL